MSRTKTPNDDPRATRDADRILDEAVRAVRDEVPSAEQARQARERAWSRLETAAANDGCAAFRADIAALKDGRLPEARAALVADHCRSCVPCRRAWRAEPADAPASPAARAAEPSRRARRGGALRIAATLALAALLGASAWWIARDPSGTSVADGRPSIIHVEGVVFTPSGREPIAIASGDVLGSGVPLRTGKDASAVVELPDGSRIELNERSELSIAQPGERTLVRLERGDIIVEAAHRRTRDLVVKTSDMEVAVKGTIFAMGHGVKGSRVAVLEGSVQVDTGAGEPSLLQPGQQAASRDRLTDGALRDQVAWSRSMDEYVALLDEIEAVQAELAEDPFEHAVRHDSTLLEAMPDGTAFYAAFPNSTENLRRFVDLVVSRIEQSPELSEWWRQAASRAGGEPGLREILESVESLSASLGDEIAVGLALRAEQADTAPVAVARVRDEASLRRLLVDLGATRPGEPVLLDRAGLESAALLGTTGQLQLAVLPTGHVVAGPSAPILLEVAERLEGDRGAFARTSFAQTLRERYRRGTELLVAADLETIVGRSLRRELQGGDADDVSEKLRTVGLSRLRHFVITTGGEEDQGTAVLSFKDSRAGMASWLAEPAPMGSLEYVSPSASVVVSAVLKDPIAMLEDVKAVVGAEEFGRSMTRFERETGLDLASDIASPLGGEMTLALDGPLFPLPSLRLIVEVYDPARLQLTIERLVQRVNDWIAETARPGEVAVGVEMSELPTRHGDAWVIRHPELPFSLHHAFDDGYLVVATDRVGLESALDARRRGASITSSGTFNRLLPKDADEDLSLIAYQNLGPAFASLLETAAALSGSGAGASASGDPRATACLVHGRASERRIALSVSSEGPGPGASLAAVLRQGLVRALQEAAEAGMLEARSPGAPAGYDEDPSGGGASGRRDEPVEPARPY